MQERSERTRHCDRVSKNLFAPARAPESSEFPGRSRRLRALALASFWLCACLALSVDAHGVERPVALGEVGARSGDRVEVTHTLRRAIEEELELIDFGGHRPRQRYVLSARLVKLDSVTESQSVRATCVVSVVLRRERGSTLEAVIQGRATAEEAKSEGESARASALRAAVHSALRRVPETVQATER